MAHVFFLLMCLVSVALCIQKRSDDVAIQSLEAVVQQQAAKIDQQTARIDQQAAIIHQMQARLTSLEASDHKLSTVVNSRESVCTDNIGATNHPLIFDVVDTNIGNGYNPHTGVFTTPVSGIYVFYAKLMNHQKHGFVHGIYRAGTILCMNDLDPGNSFDKSSCAASVHLQTGDTVTVQRVRGDANDQVLEGGDMVSFTGFLLSADTP